MLLPSIFRRLIKDYQVFGIQTSISKTVETPKSSFMTFVKPMRLYQIEIRDQTMIHLLIQSILMKMQTKRSKNSLKSMAWRTRTKRNFLSNTTHKEKETIMMFLKYQEMQASSKLKHPFEDLLWNIILKITQVTKKLRKDSSKLTKHFKHCQINLKEKTMMI